ncbi:hypothetical protein L249_8623 [Ophiocordyceps polyrhachis-furcata BCC 54312]|uniref:Uncharacterized protein n=1 Tax=Ophiocordyceps polyrhachis-furcata BCC 54312 TaxID=1330021 RepID=A0A367L6X1_9HYPO|nr:hypothetical protein L249_8623 [Ophiocordyceps polyrhachis-furcata BCC 54312]
MLGLLPGSRHRSRLAIRVRPSLAGIHFVSSSHQIQRLLDVARPELDRLLPPVHALQLAVRKLPPPFKNVDVLMHRGADEHFGVEDEFAHLDPSPAAGYLGHAVAVRHGYARRVPPPEHLGLSVLCGPEQRSSRPEHDALVLRRSVAPPLEHQ